MYYVKTTDCICKLWFGSYQSENIRRIMREAGIYSVEHLCKKTPEELMCLNGIGKRMVEIIEEELDRHNLRLSMTDDDLEYYNMHGGLFKVD